MEYGYRGQVGRRRVKAMQSAFQALDNCTHSLRKEQCSPFGFGGHFKPDASVGLSKDRKLLSPSHQNLLWAKAE